MINYESINDAVYALFERPLLVVYRGIKTRKEAIALDKFKAFHFVSDELEFRNHLCGMEYSGILIEEDAELSFYNIRYALSRFRGKNNKTLLVMDEKHRLKLEDALEEIMEQSSGKDVSRVFTDGILSNCITHSMLAKRLEG